VARAVKGQRAPCLRSPGIIKRAVEREGQRQEEWVKGSLAKLAEGSGGGSEDEIRGDGGVWERPYGGRDEKGYVVAVPADCAGDVVEWEADNWGLWDEVWFRRCGAGPDYIYVR